MEGSILSRILLPVPRNFTTTAHTAGRNYKAFCRKTPLGPLLETSLLNVHVNVSSPHMATLPKMSMSGLKFLFWATRNSDATAMRAHL